MGCKFARRGIMGPDEKQYWISVVDQFSGYLAPKVVGSIVRMHSRVPIIR